MVFKNKTESQYGKKKRAESETESLADPCLEVPLRYLEVPRGTIEVPRGTIEVPRGT